MAPTGLPNFSRGLGRAGSNLEVADSRFTANRDLSILFEGDRLTARRSLFVHNQDTGLKALSQKPGLAMYKGRRSPALTTVHVSDCKFVNNTSQRGPGGAMSMGARVVVSLNDTVFQGNSADAGNGCMSCVWGGGACVHAGACACTYTPMHLCVCVCCAWWHACGALADSR